MYPWLEFDPDNCKLLCFWHHFRWWHIDIIGAAFWIAAYLREDRENRIIMGANTPVEVTRDFLYEKEAELLMEVEMLTEGGVL
jgi:hypothetical protein